MSRVHFSLALAVAVAGGFAARASAQDSGPSFNCAHATSRVNQMICASPDLSALDRQLADDYTAIVNQGGVDQQAIAAAQDHWLHKVRNACTTPSCIARAYTQRDAALRALSQHAASPAADADTRPFPAPARVLRQAQSWIGKACGGAPAHALPGTIKAAGMSVITTNGAYVVPLDIQGTRFAFLLTYTDQDFSTCRIRDVVSLPRRVSGEQFLQCHLADDDSFGFAIRTRGATTAYWSTDASAGKITRQPIHVIGDGHLKCQQPETGE